METPEAVAAAVRERLAGVPADTVLIWARLPGQAEDRAVEPVRTVVEDLAPLLA